MSLKFTIQVQQKKEENTADMMAYMESQKAAMQEAITLHLKALTDPEKNFGRNI